MPSSSKSSKAKIMKDLQNEMLLIKFDIDIYASLMQAAVIIGLPLLFLGITIAMVAIFAPGALVLALALSVVAALIYAMVMVNLPQEEYQEKISTKLTDYLLEDVEREIECNLGQSYGSFFKTKNSTELEEDTCINSTRRCPYR